LKKLRSYRGDKMSKLIKLLDNKTINKIAAGEVVERPSSVVKELVENSIDAKATSINIEIAEGGKEYIRITDNGTGIHKDDIELAFLRHSTSKIASVEDLYRITSLGFRGEALASIAAVSQLELITKVEEDSSGKQIEIHGGQLISKKEIGCPKGTTIIVKNLFYNVPVRLKFIKSHMTESSYISDIVYKLAMGNPSISFKFIKDNKLILKTSGNDDLSLNIYSLFGRDFADSLFKMVYIGEDIKIEGFVSKPSFTRGNRSHQYIFVNGRYVRNDDITRAIEEVYKSLIPINRFPMFVIYISINTKDVDINIHPNKMEVRFKDQSIINKITEEMVKNTLSDKNLIPEITINKRNEKVDTEQTHILDVIDSRDKLSTTEEKKASIQYNKSTTESNEFVIKENSWDKKSNDAKKDFPVTYNNYEKKKIPKIPHLTILGRLFNTYILAEDKNEDAFYMIDQHAAHERIMYEKFKEQYEKEEIFIQDLLTPEILSLTLSEFQLFKENKIFFEKLGFRMEDFGQNDLLIRSVPLIFGKPNSKSLFLDILDKLQYDVKSSYDLRLEKIIKMACTNAVKAGDNIGEIEIDRLIEDLREVEEPYTCPHGRPVIVKMTKYELEKKFKRIQ